MGILDPDQTFGDLFSQGTMPPEQQPQTAAGSGLMDSLQGYKAQQAQMLEEHKDYGQRLERTAEATGERGKDLHLVERVYTMLDERVPKGTKQFLYREMARTMGLDGKDGVTGEIGKMLTGLDPQSAGVLKTLVNEQMKSADPGAIQGLLKGIMTGTIPMHEVTKMAGMTAQQKAMQEAGQAQELGQKMQQGQAAKAPLPGMMKLGGPTDEQNPAIPDQSKVPYEAREVDPVVRGRLGSDVRDDPRPKTVSDLEAAGYKPIPTDPALKKAWLEGIDAKKLDYTQYMEISSELATAVKDRPELLGWAGAMSRFLADVGAFRDAMVGQGAPGFLPKGAQDWINKQAEKRGITAADSAKVQSMIQNLAYYQGRIAWQQTGQGFSNNDKEAALKAIGASQDPKQLIATLTMLADQAHNSMNTYFNTHVGKMADIPVRDMTYGQLAKLADSPVLPASAKALLGAEVMRRDAMQEQRKGGAQQQQGGAQQQQQQQEPTQAERLRGQTAKQVADERGFLLEQRDMMREGNARANRSEERAERGEQRQIENDKKAEAKERRAAIQKAFDTLAKAFSDQGGGFPSARGGGGGPEQSAEAFRLPPRPQRQAPRIGK